VVDQHPPALETLPGESGLGGLADEEESVLLVDLGEVRVLPCSSGPKPCEGADCATCTVPSSSPAIADLPGGETECFGSRPSFCRYPPAIVAISGV